MRYLSLNETKNTILSLNIIFSLLLYLINPLEAFEGSSARLTDIPVHTTSIEELLKHTDDPSNVFYLAQSYKAMQQYDQAITWYTTRISQGGERDEVWYSKFMLGEIYNLLGNREKGLEYYLDAYEYNPARAEPLEKITLHYRLNKQYELAYLFARQGIKIPYPPIGSLFVDPSIYNYRFDEELSIAAYYTSFKQDGFESIEKLLLNKSFPTAVKEQAHRNLRFYVQELKDVHLKSLPINPPLIRDDSTLKYNPMNPSIIKTDNGYSAICRCVNYVQKGGKDHKMILQNPHEKFLMKTRNFLLEYDKDFNLVSQKEIIDELSSSLKYSPRVPIEGFEDSRLFKFNETLWISATVHDMDTSHMPQIGLYRLPASSSNPSKIHVEHFIPLKRPRKDLTEKNWLPFAKDKYIYMIYSFDPLIIYKVDPATGEYTEAVNREQKHDYSYYRGSAGPISFMNGYLVVVHHVAFDNDRFYFHRFLRLDADHNITHYSKPFIYEHHGVEFCSGMTIDHSGTNLIMTVGIEDREAILAFIPLDTVKSLLIPIQ